MLTYATPQVRALVVPLVLWALFGLAGCGPSGPIGEQPTAREGEPHSKVVVIRAHSPVGGALTHTVSLDGNDVFKLKSGGHTELPVGPGHHYIGVKCFGGWTLSWKEDSVPFLAAAGGTYYFEIRPNKVCAAITPIQSGRAKDLLNPSLPQKIWYKLTNQ